MKLDTDNELVMRTGPQILPHEIRSHMTGPPADSPDPMKRVSAISTVAWHITVLVTDNPPLIPPDDASPNPCASMSPRAETADAVRRSPVMERLEPIHIRPATHTEEPVITTEPMQEVAPE